MDTDKIAHGYGPFYQDIAAELQARTALDKRAPHVLEIGAAWGAGLQYFIRLFDGNLVLSGVELIEERAVHAQELTSAPVYFGNATHSGLTAWLAFRYDAFEKPSPWLLDLVVDDGSHDPFDVIPTFRHLWPYVFPGGWYVVEDWTHVDAPMRAAFKTWARDLSSQPAVDKVAMSPPGILAFRKAPMVTP